MSTFRGKPLAKGLRLDIDPRGWLGRPQLRVWDGISPVLTFYVMNDGFCTGWLTTWGLFGNEHQGSVTDSEVAALMGWQMPEQMRAAA